MHPSIAPIVELYKMNTATFQRILNDVEDKNEFSRPSENVNSVNWIAGHMLASRYILANMVGIEDSPAWLKLYARSAKIKEQSEYPPLKEIRQHWDEVSTKLLNIIPDLSEDQLLLDPPFEPPACENNKRGLIAFMQMHESYHLGQLAYIERYYGGDQPFG